MVAKAMFDVRRSIPAGADLSAKQFYVLEGTTSASVCNAITDVPIGILQNKPDAAGKAAEVIYLGGSKAIAGAAVSVGDLLSVDTSGRVVAVTPGSDTTTYVFARALSAATAANQIIDVLVDAIAPARAA